MLSAVWPCSLFQFGIRIVFWGLSVDPLDVVGYGLHGLFVRSRGASLDREDRRRFRSVYSPFLGYLGPVGVFA